MSQEQVKNIIYEVQCPQCARTLRASSRHKAYVCPSCAKIIRIRLMRKYILEIEDEKQTKVQAQAQEAVVCTEEKLDVSLETAAAEVISAPLVEEVVQEKTETLTIEGSKAEKLEIPFGFEAVEEAEVEAETETETETETEVEEVEENLAAKAAEKPKRKNIISEAIKKRYSRLERRDFLFAYLLVLFPVAQFLIFWFYVNASSIALAFQNDLGEFTLSNFKMVYNGFVDHDMFGINLGKSLMRSFILWIIGEGLIFPIGLVTTYVLTRKILGHYVFRIIYIVPSLMGAIIWTLLIKEMVSYSGPITQAVKALGVKLPFGAQKNGLLRHEDTAFVTLVTIRSVMGIVGNNAVLTGAYTRVPTELFESAELDGANFSTELFKIAIPCIWSTICTLLTFALCSIFTCDYNVYLFTNGTGGYETSTIGFQLFNLTYQLSQGSSSTGYGYPAALGFVLTLMTLPIALIGKAVLERMSENVEV